MIARMPKIGLMTAMVLLLVGKRLSAAFEVETVNPSLIGRAGICSLHPMSSNPAADLELSGWNLRSNYTQLFGLKEIRCWDLYLLKSWSGKRAAHLAVRSLGNALYAENCFTGGYASAFGEDVHWAVSLRYYRIDIPGYGQRGWLGLSLGSKFTLSDRLHCALLLQNLNRAWGRGQATDIPESFVLACQWFPWEYLEIDAEIFKDTLYPFSTRLGLQLHLVKYLSALMGVQLQPDRLACGLSFHWKAIRFDAALLHHTVLPATLYIGCALHIP